MSEQITFKKTGVAEIDRILAAIENNQPGIIQQSADDAARLINSLRQDSGLRIDTEDGWSEK